MTMNTKTFIEYDRFEWHKSYGLSDRRKVHIWRKRTVNLTKEEIKKARENKENLNIKVS